MDMSFNKADRKFRDDVRAFIAEKYDEDLRRKMSFSKNGYLDKAGQIKWQKALNDRGWAAVNWPKEHGGAGFTPNEKYIFDIEMAAAGTPIVSPMGLKMVAPVIMAFGNAPARLYYQLIPPSWLMVMVVFLTPSPNAMVPSVVVPERGVNTISTGMLVAVTALLFSTDRSYEGSNPYAVPRKSTNFSGSPKYTPWLVSPMLLIAELRAF